MEEPIVEAARERLASRMAAGDAEAALERARTQLEALGETVAEFEASLPERVGEAVREGMQREALPVGRAVAEVRGLAAQMIRRLERLEGDLAAERHARIDDVALLVELVTRGWKSVTERLDRLEERLAGEGAVVYRMPERASG